MHIDVRAGRVGRQWLAVEAGELEQEGVARRVADGGEADLDQLIGRLRRGGGSGGGQGCVHHASPSPASSGRQNGLSNPRVSHRRSRSPHQLAGTVEEFPLGGGEWRVVASFRLLRLLHCRLRGAHERPVAGANRQALLPRLGTGARGTVRANGGAGYYDGGGVAGARRDRT